jgi:Amino acid permease
VESFAASFCALNFIGAVRFVYSRTHKNGLLSLHLALDPRSFWVYSLVGPQQYGTFDARVYCISNCPNGLHSPRSNYLITMVFMFITAAVLAEICSALPLSGSIYIWAAESAGPKRARFFGFLVAWWSTTAWMTFTAGNCQVSLVTQLALAAVLTRILLGNSELHCVTARRMGGRLSRWYRKRQH